MRKAGAMINGKGVEFYWHETLLPVGTVHEMRASGKMMIVAEVLEGTFNCGEGEGYGHILRKATQEEIDAYNSLSPRMSDEKAEAIFERIAYIGS